MKLVNLVEMMMQSILSMATFLNLMFSRLSRIIVNINTSAVLLGSEHWRAKN